MRRSRWARRAVSTAKKPRRVQAAAGAEAPRRRKPALPKTSFDLREVGRVHEGEGRRAGQYLPVLFGFGGYLLPFRIGAKFRPILGGLLAALVGNDVDQSGLRFFRILRDPVSDALHPVARENADGVIAETSLQGVQLAFVANVGAQ